MTRLLSPVLVTGASRGLGRAIALAFARTRAHVVALARTQAALEELDDEIQAAGGSATLVPVDLRDFDAIDRLGIAILERWGKLDAFIANAGLLGEIAPLGHIDQPVWDAVMMVNVTANWRLIRALDPALRASTAGRAIFVSSGAARSCKAYWGPYSVSKAALEALARTYAAETASTSVRVAIVDPGPMRTKMRRAAMPGEDAGKLRAPEDVAARISKLLEENWASTGEVYNLQNDNRSRLFVDKEAPPPLSTSS